MRTRVGYAGGEHRDPTYEDLGDHAEAFALDFDPRVIAYEDLLELFWTSHNASRAAHSRQYMAAVFPTALQLDRAMASRERIAGAKTPVIANARFYLAEDYHQKYYLRHDRILMAELAAYSSSAFVDSTVAARLNAYVAGNGSRDQLEIELDDMALSPAAAQHLRDQFEYRHR